MLGFKLKDAPLPTVLNETWCVMGFRVISLVILQIFHLFKILYEISVSYIHFVNIINNTAVHSVAADSITKYNLRTICIANIINFDRGKTRPWPVKIRHCIMTNSMISGHTVYWMSLISFQLVYHRMGSCMVAQIPLQWWHNGHDTHPFVQA